MNSLPREAEEVNFDFHCDDEDDIEAFPPDSEFDDLEDDDDDDDDYDDDGDDEFEDDDEY